MQKNRLNLVWWAITLIALAGCQGNGGQLNALPVANNRPEVPPALLGAPPLPNGVPADFPTHEVAAQDNNQYGNEVVAVSASGAEIEDTTLHLNSTSTAAAWGMWCWGNFREGFLPLKLKLDVQPVGGGEFWLLLSNYSDNQWEYRGPLVDGAYEFTYWTGADYLSAGRYTYAVLLVTGANALDVPQLNLTADEDVTPPAIPSGVGAYPPSATAVTLFWDENSEPDLDRYNAYSGPAADFNLDDDGVVFRGYATSLETEIGISDLSPETTYYFRLTAVDKAQNESLPSDTVTATTNDADLPPPPTDLTINEFSSSWAEVSWTAPPDPQPQGYEVFTGPVADFQVGDPGVVKRHNGLISETHYRITDLLSETLYYVGVRAYHSSEQSPIGNTPSFTTEASIPPEPSFSYSPLEVKAGLPVTFDPTATTDVDTPLDELLFKWDFSNDGSVDRVTAGPELVQHTYSRRGPVTCKLTVTDGTYVSTTKDLVVGIRFDYLVGAASTGLPGSVVAADTYPAHPRMAFLVTYGDSALVETYQDSNWQTIDASSIEADVLCDVALKPVAASILAVDIDGADLTWTVYGYSASTWSSTASQQITADTLALARLDIAPSGRIAVAVIAGSTTGPDTDYTLHVWHQQVGGSLSSDSLALGTNEFEPVDVQRNDTTSHFVYCDAGDIHQWSFTDGADSDSAVQSITGQATQLATGVDPDSDDRVYWAAATDADRIYYGDNYGTANGDQQISLTYPASAMLGVGLTSAGDNELVFYWTDEDSGGDQRLLGYDSSAGGGSGENYEIVSGVGVADGGAGAYVVIDSTAGVYTTCNETRDGECTGRFLVEGATESTTAVFQPQGAADITGKHQSVLMTDGTMLSLSGQQFATARGSYATFLGQPLTYQNVGDNFWCVPDAACPMAYAGDYLVGGYTPDGLLVTNWFLTDQPEDYQVGVYADTALAYLAYNTASGNNLLCYTLNNSQNVVVRNWEGLGWSDPITVYSGTQQIEQLVAVGRPDFEWGLAFLDSADKLQLVESDMGVWQSAVELSSFTANGPAGVGLDYSNNGDLCVALERTGPEPGVWLGIWPSGGSLAWERIVTTTGSDATSIHAFYHLSSPLVLYYQIEVPLADSRIQVVEKLGGIWTATELAEELHGTPVAMARNSGGDIVITGYSTAFAPHRAAVGIFYR
jgi:hypothetical protein